MGRVWHCDENLCFTLDSSESAAEKKDLDMPGESRTY